MGPQARGPGLDISQATLSRQGGHVPPISPHPGNLVTYAENYADNGPHRNASVTNRSLVSAPSISESDVPQSEPTDDERMGGNRQSYSRAGPPGTSYTQGVHDGIPEEEEYNGRYDRRQEQPAPVLPPIKPVGTIDFNRERSESRAESRHGDKGQVGMGTVEEEEGLKGEEPQLSQQQQQVQQIPRRRSQSSEVSVGYQTPARGSRSGAPHPSIGQRSVHESDASSLHSNPRSTPQPEQQMGRMGLGYERNYSVTSQTVSGQGQGTGMPSLRTTSPAPMEQQGFQPPLIQQGHYRQPSLDVGERYGQQPYPPLPPPQQYQWQGSGNVEQGLGLGGQPHEQQQKQQIHGGHGRTGSASSFGTQPSIIAVREDGQGSPQMRHGSMSATSGQQFVRQQNLTRVDINDSRTGAVLPDGTTISPPQSQHGGSTYAPPLLGSPTAAAPQSSHGPPPQSSQGYPTRSGSPGPGPFRAMVGRPQSPSVGGQEDKRPHPLANSFAPTGVLKKERGEGRRVSSFLGGVLGAKGGKGEEKKKFSFKEVGNIVSTYYFCTTGK